MEPTVFVDVNPKMRIEIFEAVDLIRGDPEVRCAVITGAGRAFCTGADISGRSFPHPVEGDPGNMLHGRTSDLRWGWHAAAHLGASVSAPPQYWRSQPSGLRHLFDDVVAGVR